MRFEGRELPPYVEPISASELEKGAVYFSLLYVDEELLIPTIETLIFIGKDLEPDDVGKAYFQDVESYREGVLYDWEAEDVEATFFAGSENELGHIFIYERALEELMRCSLRRKQKATKGDQK